MVEKRKIPTEAKDPTWVKPVIQKVVIQKIHKNSDKFYGKFVVELLIFLFNKNGI